MKFLNAFTFCLLLPFAFMACDQKADDEAVGNANSETHEAVYTEYFAMMEDALGTMGSIEGQETANAYLAKTNEMAPQLLEILSRAKALPAPSDEEKEAAQSLHAEVMERIKEQQKLDRQKAESRELTPEAKAAINMVRVSFGSGNFGVNMRVVSRQMDAIYGLKNY